MKKYLAFCVGLFISAPLFAEPHVSASLVSLSKTVSPGKPFTASVRLKMSPGWHTYSEPPGDSGLATKIVWELPPGFSAAKIQWPRPMKISANGITNFVYENSVDLKVKISPPNIIKEKKIRLKALVKWLECRDVCLPGSSPVDLELPVSP